jgi:hypothetical protein
VDNHAARGKQGAAAIPHREFWGQLGGLVAGGIPFAKDHVVAPPQVHLGLGRIVTLYYRSSTSYHIR